MHQKPQLNFFIWWPVIIVGLIAFWPVGIVLLLVRLYKDKQAALRAGQILKIFSYVLFGFSAIFFLATLAMPDETGWMAVSFVFFLALALYLISRKLISDARKTRQYMTAIINHHERDLGNLSSILNIPYEKVSKDLAKLIDRGLLKGAVIDQANRRIRLAQDHAPSDSTQSTQTSTLNSINTHKSYTVTNVSASLDPATMNKIFENVNNVMMQFNNESIQAQHAAAQQANAQQPASQPRVTQCKFCGANNSVSNNTGECEYCGSPL